MQRLVCKGALARRDSIVVDAVGTAVSAAEGAEINHSARCGPHERMRAGSAGSRTTADDLTGGVHSKGEALAGAAEREGVAVGAQEPCSGGIDRVVAGKNSHWTEGNNFTPLPPIQKDSA